MISTYQLSKLDARLKQSTSTQLPFGGINILFFGDFVQYPPVGGTPLYIPISPPGWKFIVHENPNVRGTWSVHGLNAFYTAPAMQH